MLHIKPVSLTRLFNSKDKISALLGFSKTYHIMMMKGVLVSEFGPADVCKYKTDLSIPEPADDQVEFCILISRFQSHDDKGQNL